MNFPQKYHLYNEYATVQQQVAHNLQFFMEEKIQQQPFKILEIGCGTGIFTELLNKSYPHSAIVANDLFNTADYVAKIPQVEFIQGDITSLNLTKYNLITSSSVFQWISDLSALLAKLSKAGDELVFAMYLEGNLQEIKDHFGNSLNYHTLDQVKLMAQEHFPEVVAQGETIILDFSTPRQALRHLKNTGVTGGEFKTPSMEQLRSFKAKTLTYEVGYFYCR